MDAMDEDSLEQKRAAQPNPNEERRPAILVEAEAKYQEAIKNLPQEDRLAIANFVVQYARWQSHKDRELLTVRR